MSTKASNPTVSKLDAAQQDRPTADDQEGNLSEKQVDERFKALPEDTRLLLEKLETEFERRYIGSVSDILEWNAYLTKTLEKPDLVDLFTKWTFFRRPEPKDDLRTIDLEEFRKHLAATNWKFKNEDYDRVFDLMWNSRGNNPSKFLLKQLNDNFLAVAVDPRCLTPRDPSHDSLEAYDIVDSNLFNILGLRYRKDGVTKEMIIAPFGQILFCTHPEKVRFSSKEGHALGNVRLPWKVSEYALVLEICEDGKAGDFYFVYNVADADLPTFEHKDLKGSPLTTDAEDSTVSFKPFLCGLGPFTVGKVKGSMESVKGPLGLGLLVSRPHSFLHWLGQSILKGGKWEAPFDPYDNIQLDVLSISTPDIVMTGIRESQKGREIVGLYDKE